VQSSEPREKQPTLRLRVTSTAEWKVRSGHPWIFSDSIRAQNRPGALGEVAVIYDKWDNFLAIGLFEPHSPLRVRMLHVGKPQTLDDAWWRGRLDSAIALREKVFDGNTTGYRCINGESDGWPALVLDRYADTLVLKLYSAIWLQRIEQITQLIVERVRPARVVLRLSRNIQEQTRPKGDLEDGALLFGAPVEGPVVFRENGLRFEADVLRGQKTGFFLDQRENRAITGELAKGHAVLNAFSYSGGFSVYAARAGATRVTDLDISPHALEAARRNFHLNEEDTRGCAHQCVKADAFDWLKQHDERFGVVVLDPPSFAKRESERAPAIEAYTRLARLGIGHVEPGGFLVAASCSAHVSADEFFEAVRIAARKSGRRFAELQTTGHAPDHPAKFAEADYLKCIYAQFR
jgi:23S rRNA (cytosine1962-C5)-methyltransferase